MFLNKYRNLLVICPHLAQTHTRTNITLQQMYFAFVEVRKIGINATYRMS